MRSVITPSSAAGIRMSHSSSSSSSLLTDRVRGALSGLGTFTLKDPAGFELSYTPSGRPSTDALGEDFEKKEDELFGDEGFFKVVDQVAELEKKLGIYDLAQFTPK